MLCAGLLYIVINYLNYVENYIKFLQKGPQAA